MLPMSSAPDVLHEYQSMSQTCAELRHSILLIHQMGSPIELINASSPTMKDLFLPSSSLSSMTMFDSGGRGRRLISSSISDCPIPSFSSRQIDAITRVQSKVSTIRLLFSCQAEIIAVLDVFPVSETSPRAPRADASGGEFIACASFPS